MTIRSKSLRLPGNPFDYYNEYYYAGSAEEHGRAWYQLRLDFWSPRERTEFVRWLKEMERRRGDE